MVSTAKPPASDRPTATGEQRVMLQGVTWQGYQDILQALPESRAARLTFDNGKLEIVMPLELHEQGCELIGLFIRILVVEMGLKMKSIRSTRLERDDLNRGAEPDNAYYIQNQAKVAGRQINLANDPPPDLVVEVDISHTDIDKNQFYASMGIPEFWRFDGQTWQILTLDGDRYTEVDQSPTFPIVEKPDLYAFLEQAYIDEVEAEINFRGVVRTRLA